MKPLKSQDYYEILGIPRHSTQEDIRRAYEICRHTYHEDSLATYSLFSEQENQEIFALITQAYEVLSSPNGRREYDAYLANKEGRNARDPREGERIVASMIGIGPEGAPPPPPAREPEPQARAPRDGRKPAPVTVAAPAGEQDAPQKFMESVTEYSGAALKKLRELRGISLDELSELTKIRKTYLEYLEVENFEFLPASVYVKGFVTILASALDAPAHRVAEEYMARVRAHKSGEKK